MKWFFVIGLIAFVLAMIFVNDKKDIDAVMKKVRAAKKKKYLQKNAGGRQGGNQTQGDAPAKMKVA